MRIIGLTDLHDRIINFDKLLRYKPDVFLISGDIIHKGDTKILDFLKNLNEKVKVFIIPGNWENPEIKEEMEKSGLSIDEKVVKFEDTVFVGLGGSNKTPIGSPNEYEEYELYSRFYNSLKEQDKDNLQNNFIFLSHVPPKDTMADRCSEGHVGSTGVRKVIEEFKPALCACGHVHESRCIDKIGNSLIVNPSLTGFFIYDTKTKNLEIHDL